MLGELAVDVSVDRVASEVGVDHEVGGGREGLRSAGGASRENEGGGKEGVAKHARVYRDWDEAGISAMRANAIWRRGSPDPSGVNSLIPATAAARGGAVEVLRTRCPNPRNMNGTRARYA